MDESTASDLLALLFLSGFALVFFIVGILFYILFGLGLMKIAKREGVENAWLAFIPIANYFVLGEVVSEKLGGKGGVKLLWISIGGIVLSLIPVIGVIASIGLAVFYFVVFHWLYDRYSNNAVLFTVFSVITAGALVPIFVFAIRNSTKEV
jgi:hypothetical protein